MKVSTNENKIILSNAFLQLTLGTDGKAHSILCLPTGEELLDTAHLCPLCSVTQERFYNNELKLMHTSRRTTLQSNFLRYEDGLLFVGFEEVCYEAVIKIEDKEQYFTFTLEDFIRTEEAIPSLCMAKPPVDEFRILQLPVRKREQFGKWLLLVSDEKTAVCLTTPDVLVRADFSPEEDHILLFAVGTRGMKLKGATAALLADANGSFLDRMDRFEKDFNLPSGVQSRRSELINASVYWVYDADLQNIDEHIAYAKKGGFRLMLFYYTCFFKENGYEYCGDYDFKEEFPNGLADIRTMLGKVHAAGILPGFHFLQTHIGLKSRYMTPEADHRVLHRQMLTLAKPVSETDSEIFTDQFCFDPDLPQDCRLLRIGRELISYTDVSLEYPYRFTGCKRGFNGTAAVSHEAGTAAGVVWVSEYGAMSVYADQRTDLPDEVANKIAEVYNQGFRFIYFDGSEGAMPPFENFIPLAQWRVYKKCKPEPLFCEGAAKGHFSWHMLSGGNAFDIFPTDIFKAMIDRYPLHEAPLMQQDRTRLNFGWWEFYEDTLPDTYEYGTSRAAGFGCPATLRGNLQRMKNHPRTDDILEVLRRWEDVRQKNLLTEEQKKDLQAPQKEHILLLLPSGDYALVPCKRMQTPETITAYRFKYNNKLFAVIHHNTGEGELFLPLTAESAVYTDEIDRDPIELQKTKNGLLLPVSKRRYFTAEVSVDELEQAFLHCAIRTKEG